ncbi:MAG: response regulator transcription factor, partial [Parasphingopyxis sp.]|uniref:helix-turn-helix transcriptional regulator n=1 Tax=Parasphingopyxis sp. TaxID=1920299 RepID=UPI003FA08A77
ERTLDAAPVLCGAADAGMEDALGIVGLTDSIDPSGTDLAFGFGFGGCLGTAQHALGKSHEIMIAAFVLIDRLIPRFWAAADGLDTALSTRELEVLRYLAAGLRRDRIAWKLDISLPTVDLHAANLRKKLGAHTLPHAVAKGYRYGLL